MMLSVSQHNLFRAIGFILLLFTVISVNAEDASSLRFPGDPADNKVVYQFNQADKDYQEHILFSAGQVLQHYGDNVEIVITAIGPGIHILGKNPKRPVSDEIKAKVKSLADYGVKFHACGNTMKAVGWTDDDMLEFAEVVQIGAIDLIELQQQGYSYISW